MKRIVIFLKKIFKKILTTEKNFILKNILYFKKQKSISKSSHVKKEKSHEKFNTEKKARKMKQKAGKSYESVNKIIHAKRAHTFG